MHWLNNFSTLSRDSNNFSNSASDIEQNVLSYSNCSSMNTNKNSQVSTVDCFPTMANNTFVYNLKNANENMQNFTQFSQCIEAMDKEMTFNTIENIHSLNSNLLEKNSPSLVKQESLRENIEKITQLQSELISALSSDNLEAKTEQINNRTNLTLNQNDEYIHEDKTIVKDNYLNTNNQLEVPKEVFEENVTNNMAQLSLNSLPLTSKEAKDERNFLSQLDLGENSYKLTQQNSRTDEKEDQELQSIATVKDKDSENITNPPVRKNIEPRIKHPIEIESEQMLDALTSMLSPNDSIMSFLTTPNSNCITDHIGPLYSFNIPLKPRRDDVGKFSMLFLFETSIIYHCNCF